MIGNLTHRALFLAMQSADVGVGDPYFDKVVTLLHFDYDPYYANVTALLHMNGVDNGTTFTDETGKIITRVGTPFTKNDNYKFSGSSYFNASNVSGLSLPSLVDFTPTGDFTAEVWAYASAGTDFSSTKYIINTRGYPSISDTSAWFIYVLNGVVAAAQFYSDGTIEANLVGSTVLSTGVWYHISYVRKGDMYYLFLNGKLEVSGQGAHPGFAPTDAHSLRVGYGFTPSGPDRSWRGYLQDVRITKGIARYTTNFTPPTRSFAYSPTNIRDEKAKIWALNGNAVQSAIAKYGNAGLTLDGTQDFISADDSPDFDILGGEFTIECWVRPTMRRDFNFICGKDVTTGQRDFRWGLTSSGTVGISFQYGTAGSSATGFNSTIPVPLNVYTHIVAQRRGNTLEQYVGGIPAGSLDVTGLINVTTTNRFYVGTNGSPAQSNVEFAGNIDEFRFTKGIARYNGNFTPTSKAFPDRLSDLYGANVVSLLHFDGANGSTIFTDEAKQGGTSRIWTTVGATISTTQSKFGSSGAFTPTNRRIYTPNSSDFNFGSGDYTIECFVYIVGAPNGAWHTVVSNILDSPQQGVRFLISSARNLGIVSAYWAGGTQTTVIAPSAIIPLAQWTHIAWSGNSGTHRAFINGVLDSQFTSTSNIIDSTYVLNIGHLGFTTNWYANMYIDELRITKGIGRYTANFTPPAVPFSIE